MIAYTVFSLQAQENHGIATFPLSRYFGKIVNHLLKQTNERCDSLLQTAAHQALKNVLISSPDDCYDIVLNTLLVLLHQLQEVCVFVWFDEKNSNYLLF